MATTDLNEAQYLDDVPDGATVGLACRTTSGEWFFLHPAALEQQLSWREQLQKDEDVHWFWESVKPQIIEKYPLKSTTGGQISGITVDGVFLPTQICNFEFGPPYFSADVGSTAKISTLFFMHFTDDLELAGVPQSVVKAFATTGAGMQGVYFATAGTVTSYVYTNASVGTVGAIVTSGIDFSSGWHCFCSVAEFSDTETTISLYQNGNLIGSGSSTTKLAMNTGTTTSQDIDGDEYMQFGMIIRMLKTLSPEEQLEMFEQFKTANSIA